MPMSFYTQLMILSFAVLTILWCSYWLRGENQPSIPLFYWCIAQIHCFIAILGIGVMQTHLGCMSLWGDCYAHNYPTWLANYKPLFLHSITVWCLLAVGAAVWNFAAKVGEIREQSRLLKADDPKSKRQ